jgi:hypothetical protein
MKITDWSHFVDCSAVTPGRIAPNSLPAEIINNKIRVNIVIFNNTPPSEHLGTVKYRLYWRVRQSVNITSAKGRKDTYHEQPLARAVTISNDPDPVPTY